MNGKLIAAIYFYLVSAASLAIFVIGLFHTTNFIINITQYEKYPLKYRSDNCQTPQFYREKYAPMLLTDETATPSAEELEDLKKQCQDDLDKERKQARLEDLKNAATYTLIGSLLFLIHFPLARKQYKE